MADSDSAALTSTSPESLRLQNAIEALAPGELVSLLPTAIQCVKSTRPQAQQAGLMVLFAAGQTPASAALFDTYISDFDAILSQSDSPNVIPNRRQVLIAILEITRPSMSPRTIQLFFGHLQDKANTALETGVIAAAVLHAAPANETSVRQVLSFAVKRSEHDVKYPVLQEIGLSKIQPPEALDFIAKQLDDPAVRSGAISAVVRLHRDVRARFTAQLSSIAQDPDERADIRAQALAAINAQ
jgi:hypothetical protein